MNESSLLGVLSESNLKIHRASFVRLDSSWNFTTRGSVFSRLYFVSGGEGFIRTRNQEFKLREGNVYFIPPNCKFSCGCEHMEKTFFHIAITTLEKYDFFYGKNQIYELPYSKEKQEILKNLLKTDNYLDILKLKLLLLETVVDFCDKYPEESIKIKKYTPLTQNIITYIDENLSMKLTVSEISKALFLSESKIRNAFKEEMNMPIGKYIDDMVFIKARQLLIDSSKSVATVSAELGFCDQFYFSRRFKEKFARTPTKFKTENKIT